MGDIYLYASSFLGHWWPLVSAGSLLGIEEFAARYSTWAKERLDELAQRSNRRVALLLPLVLAGFWSGYLAWKDEHSLRSKAEEKSDAAASISKSFGSRVLVSAVEKFGEHDGRPIIRITFENRGNLDANYPMMFIKPFLVSAARAAGDEREEDNAFMSVDKEARETKYKEISGNQITPGSKYYIMPELEASQDDKNDLLVGKKSILLAMIFEYADQNVPTGYIRRTLFCGYLLGFGSYGWNLCHSYNSTEIRPIE